MPRILITLAPSVLILVVCSWLVHVEGQSYRRRFLETAPDRLAKRLVQTGKTAARVPPPIPPRDSDGPDRTGIRIEVTKDRPAEPPHVEAKTTGSSVAPAETPEATDMRWQQVAKGDSLPPGHSPAQPATQPALANGRSVRTEPAPAPKPGWPVDPISWKDPRKLTRDEEAKIGKALHEVILRRHQVLGEEAEPAFLNHLYKLSVPLTPKDLEFNFYLLDSDDVFAFSHVGGYIYLSRRLSRLIPDDVELEFMIAHELAHLEKRHGIEKIAKDLGPEGVRPDQPGLVQRLYHQIASGYDARQEYEADAWACQRLLRLERSPHGILSFLRRLENYEVRNSRVGLMKPETPLDAEVQNVERHWRTHPRIPLRLSPLQELADPAPAKPPR